MKWINGLTSEARKRKREKWHRWFAWYPIIIGLQNKGTINERKIKVWLETIERKGKLIAFWDCDAWYYDYRRIKKGELRRAVE